MSIAQPESAKAGLTYRSFVLFFWGKKYLSTGKISTYIDHLYKSPLLRESTGDHLCSHNPLPPVQEPSFAGVHRTP